MHGSSCGTAAPGGATPCPQLPDALRARSVPAHRMVDFNARVHPSACSECPGTPIGASAHDINSRPLRPAHVTCDQHAQIGRHMVPHLSVGPCHVLCSAADGPKVCVECLMRLSIPASCSGHARRCADALALDTAHKQCFTNYAAFLYSAKRLVVCWVACSLRSQP